jgi:cytochrome b561
VLMLAILPITWAMVSMARDDPARNVWFMIHKSLGMTIFVVVVLRIVWRALAKPPVLAGRVAPWEAWSAKLNHILLYAILVVMPVSGYILSAAGGHPPTWFNLFPFPGIPESKGLARAAGAVHVTTQWVVYVLIALHLLGTVWHVAIRRDGTLERMLPRQTGA